MQQMQQQLQRIQAQSQTAVIEQQHTSGLDSALRDAGLPSAFRGIVDRISRDNQIPPAQAVSLALSEFKEMTHQTANTVYRVFIRP